MANENWRTRGPASEIALFNVKRADDVDPLAWERDDVINITQSCPINRKRDSLLPQSERERESERECERGLIGSTSPSKYDPQWNFSRHLFLWKETQEKVMLWDFCREGR